MVLLCWSRPSPQEQKACIERQERWDCNHSHSYRFVSIFLSECYMMYINRAGSFNYSSKFRGATANPSSCLQEDKGISQEGFLLNHARILVGSGVETYEKGKKALQNWRLGLYFLVEV